MSQHRTQAQHDYLDTLPSYMIGSSRLTAGDGFAAGYTAALALAAELAEHLAFMCDYAEMSWDQDSDQVEKARGALDRYRQATGGES